MTATTNSISIPSDSLVPLEFVAQLRYVLIWMVSRYRTITWLRILWPNRNLWRGALSGEGVPGLTTPPETERWGTEKKSDSPCLPAGTRYNKEHIYTDTTQSSMIAFLYAGEGPTETAWADFYMTTSFLLTTSQSHIITSSLRCIGLRIHQALN